jgi:RNA polymerase sigma factor (sigma-70 family)
MRELDDNELLREYASQNSEEAFTALVARHINQVYSVALRHGGNPSQAQEITQAVFIILARKAGSLRPGTILSAWLHQTARLTAVTLMRGEIRRSLREHEAHMQTLTDQIESDEAWKQMSPLLDGAIAELGPKDRAAIVLRFFDGKSMKEIGAALSASEDAAKKRVDRAVEKLRRCLTKRGVVFPAAVLAAALAAHSVQAAPTALAVSVSTVAIAKGATAGASTLSLINGTLKLIAWTKLKIAIIAGVATLLAVGVATVAFPVGNPAAGGEAYAAISMAHRLLLNPPHIIDCIYSQSGIGRPPGHSGDLVFTNLYYTTNYYRVGVYGSNFYVLFFPSLNEAADCANATEGHGWNEGVRWRFNRGSLIETNAAVDGWTGSAVQPLKLGLFGLGQLAFDSPTNFHATDSNGVRYLGTLSNSPAVGPNGCVISYRLEGATNNSAGIVTLTWPPGALSSPSPALPERTVIGSEGILLSELVIHKVQLAREGSPPPDFSPEKIADGRLKITRRVRDGVPVQAGVTPKQTP